MNHEESYLKPTDLDYLTGNHHLQMMKAALPYMNIPEQKMLSLFVKFSELQRTISLFNEEEVATMGICSLDDKRSPADMLRTIREYANTGEQELIDFLCTYLQKDSSSMKKSPLEQLKGFLSPAQQSQIETMQLMMQTMQQFT